MLLSLLLLMKTMMVNECHVVYMLDKMFVSHKDSYESTNNLSMMSMDLFDRLDPIVANKQVHRLNNCLDFD